MAPTMRWGLVMFFSPSRGTLKSTCGRAHVSFWDGSARGIPQRKGEWTYAHQDAFALEVDILDRELVGQRHLDGQTGQLTKKRSSGSENKGQSQGCLVLESDGR
jgi:prepilin-type processing-associated H-X9-DG protein